jgi:hypothetical protein
MNKGMKSLIKQLIKIQKEDLLATFSDTANFFQFMESK